MRAAFVGILESRGIRGLYAGLTPTLIEIVPYAGLHFGTYDTFKRWTMVWNHYRSFTSQTDDSPLTCFQLFVCGLAAGTCAKTVCQIKGLQRDPRYGAGVKHHTYRNMYHALKQILHAEGWAGLYKGITPSVVKAAPAAASALTFVAYEFSSDWLQSLLI